MEEEKYDVVVIGGGPNGLTTGAYLAKAGAEVAVIEARHETGGGLMGEDFATPFRHNLHAFHMMLQEVMPPYSDLDLGEHVSFIVPDVQLAFLYQNDEALVIHKDLEKTLKKVEKISEEDVEPFRNMWKEFDKLVEEIIIPATYVPPMPPVEQTELLRETDLGKRIAELSEMNSIEILDDYGFEDPRIRGAILYLATMWGIHPESTGLGFMIPLYVRRMMRHGIVGGGSHTLSSSIQRRFIENGGTIRENAKVTKLLIENGKAAGVETEDGRRFKGKFIISTLDPEQTFIKFIEDEDILPSDLIASVKDWEWEEWSLFNVNLGIRGPTPDFSAREYDPDVNKALTAVIGIESDDDVLEHVKQLEENALPEEPSGHLNCPTVFDPSQAGPDPLGLELNTLRFETWAPYEVKGEEWDDIKSDYSERCIKRIKEYAPNLEEMRVLYNSTWTPRDIERRLIDMKRGSIKQGAYIPMQMGYLRPNDLCSECRTPLEGLYLGGSSVYPGGMITLGPGYLSARVVAEDLDLDIWWEDPDFVVEAREKGYVK